MAATAPAPAASRAAPPKLKRTIGLWMATALVVGNMIGSGVFLLPASLAGTAGPISMFGWLFTGAGAILLALVFANLGRALPRMRLFETGGDRYEAEREQWDDGNNVLAVEPGVVVAYGAQRRHQHAPAARGHRGHHDRRLRARPWPWRAALHVLSIERS